MEEVLYTLVEISQRTGLTTDALKHQFTKRSIPPKKKFTRSTGRDVKAYSEDDIAKLSFSRLSTEAITSIGRNITPNIYLELSSIPEFGGSRRLRYGYNPRTKKTYLTISDLKCRNHIRYDLTPVEKNQLREALDKNQST